MTSERQSYWKGFLLLLSRPGWRKMLLALVVIAPVLMTARWVHMLGMYATKAEAEKRAAELKCNGTFSMGSQWMPCANERQLHAAAPQDCRHRNQCLHSDQEFHHKTDQSLNRTQSWRCSHRLSLDSWRDSLVLKPFSDGSNSSRVSVWRRTWSVNDPDAPAQHEGSRLPAFSLTSAPSSTIRASISPRHAAEAG